MRKGMLWKDLIRKFPKSTIYDTINLYAEEAQTKYHLLQKQKGELLSQIENVESLVERKKKQIQFLENNEKELVENIEELEDKNTNHSREVIALEDRLGSLQTSITKIEDRGITLEVLETILNSDVESSEDVIARVRTRQDYDALKFQLNDASDVLGNIRGEIDKETITLSGLRDETRSEKNILDQFKSENILMKESIEDVVRAKKLGFTDGIIRGLFKGLFDLSIDNQPITSAKRLLHRLENAKQEQELEYSILKLNKEKETSKRELSELGGTINALKRSVLKPIQETQDKATRAIEQVSAQGVNAVQDSLSEVITILNDARDTILTTIEAAHNLGQERLNTHQGTLLSILNYTGLTLQQSLEFYESQIQRWGEDKKEAGHYKAIIQQGILLFGVLQDEQAILALNSRIVVQVAQRLHLYVSLKYPDVKTRPPTEVARKEFALSEAWESSLTSVTQWLAHALGENQT